MKNVTFRQLRVFSEVARHLSFTKAAKNLHLTAPAVTMQVKELEGQFEMPLFERSSKKIALTTAGEYMLVYARKLLATLKDAQDMAARLRKLETGRVVIGMVSTAQYFLPQLVARFQKEHEGIEIRLTVGNREQLVRMLQANEVDVAIMGRPPQELATRAEPFAAHPHVFVTAKNHPLSRQGHPTVQALAAYPLIVREQGSGTLAAMHEFLSKAGVNYKTVMEMSSNETIKQAVIADMGVSFLSLHTLALELQCDLLHIPQVLGTPVVRAWNCVHTLSKQLSPAAEAFRYFVLEHGEGHLAQMFAKYELPGSPPAPNLI